MSMRINHNILSLTSRRHLNSTQNVMDQAVNRLSSGLRINQAWEDPSGLAVSEKFRAQIASMTEAERNANYAINLLSTAEGALSVIDEKLIRMRALSIQASNGTLTSTDRSYINTEFQQLKSEVTRIANVTNYNGLYLIDGTYSSGSGSSIKFHIGTYNVSNEDYYFVNIASMTASALGLSASTLTTTASAQSAIDLLDSAINTKDSQRTSIGSYVERLQNTILNLQISRETATASESTIRDADMALEMSTFVRSQILMQTGVAMLAQANQLPMLVGNLIS
ncbi:MAG: flagellin [Candidatus Delongbacteria bacterium]|nr:flagellin [Candidatus Delongbacteria bacterium]